MASPESRGRSRVCRGPSRSEHVFTINGEAPWTCLDGVKAMLGASGAHPVGIFAFGGRASMGACAETGLKALSHPVVWLQGDSSPVGGRPLMSMQAVAVAGAVPVQVVSRGSGRGVVFEDESSRYCRLTGLVPSRLKASREEQAREVFEMAESLLAEVGLDFRDTVRTWFYLDQLLEWYDGFNAVRTQFFRTRGVFEQLVPASTGIGAGNAGGAALVCDLIAIRPRKGRLEARGVPSPMQDSALNYRSSFSRAVELRYPEGRQLLISGTASIDREGRTVHAGDPAAQIDLTLQVVEALLASRQMEWGCATRGIAYFKRLTDVSLMEQWFRDRAIPGFPLALVEADICRHDLDFEIELDAFQEGMAPEAC